MHKLGIFAKTFSRPTFGEVLDAVLSHGLKIIHFNFACVGLPSMPESIPQELIESIYKETDARGIAIAGVSGTFNIIDPDLQKRQKGMESLRKIAESCKGIHTKLITLCSGTRDPKDMWKRHPLNDTPEAWKEVMASLKEAVKIAEEFDVFLGIEPETANVIDSPQKARRMLDEIGSEHIKIILDPANLFLPENVHLMESIIHEAFEVLGKDIVMAHAKDVDVLNGEIVHVAAGKGLLNYNVYLKHLEGHDVPLIIHGLKEEEVDPAIHFILSKSKVRA